VTNRPAAGDIGVGSFPVAVATTSGVLGQVGPYATAGTADEPRKSRFELMVPLLAEAKALVPGHRAIRILDA
jgi:hypothetical protein